MLHWLKGIGEPAKQHMVAIHLHDHGIAGQSWGSGTSHKRSAPFVHAPAVDHREVSLPDVLLFLDRAVHMPCYRDHRRASVKDRLAAHVAMIREASRDGSERRDMVKDKHRPSGMRIDRPLDRLLIPDIFVGREHLREHQHRASAHLDLRKALVCAEILRHIRERLPVSRHASVDVPLVVVGVMPRIHIKFSGLPGGVGGQDLVNRLAVGHIAGRIMVVGDIAEIGHKIHTRLRKKLPCCLHALARVFRLADMRIRNQPCREQWLVQHGGIRRDRRNRRRAAKPTDKPSAIDHRHLAFPAANLQALTMARTFSMVFSARPSSHLAVFRRRARSPGRSAVTDLNT